MSSVQHAVPTETQIITPPHSTTRYRIVVFGKYFSVHFLSEKCCDKNT